MGAQTRRCDAYTCFLNTYSGTACVQMEVGSGGKGYKKKGQRGNRNDAICWVRVYNHDEQRRHITVQTTRHNRTEGPLFFYLFVFLLSLGGQ
jgi:hypothetical protein